MARAASSSAAPALTRFAGSSASRTTRDGRRLDSTVPPLCQARPPQHVLQAGHAARPAGQRQRRRRSFPSVLVDAFWSFYRRREALGLPPEVASSLLSRPEATTMCRRAPPSWSACRSSALSFKATSSISPSLALVRVRPVGLEEPGRYRPCPRCATRWRNKSRATLRVSAPGHERKSLGTSLAVCRTCMADLLAYWRYDNYKRDLEEGAGFNFNSRQPRLHSAISASAIRSG